MRLTIDAKEFRRAVDMASLLVRRSDVTALQCIRIEAKDNHLVAWGGTYEAQCRARVDCAVSLAGKVSVNASDLKAISQRCAGSVGVVAGASGLTIECEGLSLTLPDLQSAPPKAISPSGEVEVEGGVAAFTKCAPFAATSEARPNLQGVIFDKDTAVATDGLMFFAFPITGGSGIVPLSALSCAQKIGGRLFIGERTWRLEAENVQAIGALLDYEPIRWQHIVVDAPASAEMDADDLLGSVKAATLGRASWCILDIKDGKARVSGDRFKGAHISGSCECRANGENAVYVLNTENLVRALAALSGHVITLHTNGSAVLLRPQAGEGFAMIQALRDSRAQMPKAA